MKLLNTSEALKHQSRFPDQNTLHVFPGWFQWKISRMASPENVVWTLARERERESSDWHDAVCWQTKSSIKWGSNTQRCQFSCRTLDRPDYWLQQIKVIPEYQRRAHAGWPCRTPASWGRRRERPSFEKVFTGRKWRFVSASCTVRVSCGVRKLREGAGTEHAGLCNQGSGITFGPRHQSDLS